MAEPVPTVRHGLFILLRRLRTPLVALVLVYAIAILGFTLIPAVDPAGKPWRMSFFHAFYFVSFLGSTIGLGEIPHPFNDAQRLWASGAIYATVLAWLYGIGTLLAVLQDPMFRRIVQQSRFVRTVRRLNEPFYLICGYDDTGNMLGRELVVHGVQFVVIDASQERVDALEVEDLGFSVPGLCADATDPQSLVTAGMTSARCRGVIALAGSDEVNLKIAISAKLLNPDIEVIVVARYHDVQANLASFGTDHIINPYDTFADRLAMAVRAPSLHVLYECLTTSHHTPMSAIITPPQGRWIVCGYGRFGRTVRRHLEKTEIEVQVVELEPERTGAPEGTIKGRGTEAATLREAGIESAVAIVAGTDVDANNLSIIVTARELKKDLFVIARMNERRDAAIFRAAAPDVTMLTGYVSAAEVLRIIRAPQLSYFLRLARQQEEDWADMLLERLRSVIGNHATEVWSVVLTEVDAVAVVGAIRAEFRVTLGDLRRDPRDRFRELKALPLLMQRKQEKTLLPSDAEPLEEGDRLLFCGRAEAEDAMRWTVCDDVVFSRLLTGNASYRDIPWAPAGVSRGQSAAQRSAQRTPHAR